MGCRKGSWRIRTRTGTREKVCEEHQSLIHRRGRAKGSRAREQTPSSPGTSETDGYTASKPCLMPVRLTQISHPVTLGDGKVRLTRRLATGARAGPPGCARLREPRILSLGRCPGGALPQLGLRGSRQHRRATESGGPVHLLLGTCKRSAAGRKSRKQERPTVVSCSLSP